MGNLIILGDRLLTKHGVPRLPIFQKENRFNFASFLALGDLVISRTGNSQPFSFLSPPQPHNVPHVEDANGKIIKKTLTEKVIFESEYTSDIHSSPSYITFE